MDPGRTKKELASDEASEVGKSNLELLEYEGDENQERGNWSNKMDFVLSCLGYAVGLGNVWRFPYLCYRNGGGAFLIPYTIMLLFAGLPLFFLEVSFGQYASLGPISAWRAVPFMRGMGYCQIIVATYVGIYYNVIIMYTLFYLFVSIGTIFSGKLPWVGCDNDFNTLFCSERFSDCVNSSGIILNNGTCAQLKYLSDYQLSEYNITGNLDNEKWNLTGYSDPLKEYRKSPPEEYWKEGVLQEAPTMNETGGVVWQLAVCLLIAWIIVFLCLIKGIKSSGKVVYFTAIFPYVVLVILFFRGITLPGAIKGIRFYVIPDFSKLSNPQVWLDAAIQIFYSLSAAGGGLTTLASYNKFHNNCYFDSIFVAIANCCTSIFAGFVIFSIIGFMATELGVEVDKVVDEGFGLAFVAYPAAVARMPVSTLWAILFFFMLLTLGLDSQFAIMENVVTAIVDEFPAQLRKRKSYFLGFLCFVFYLLGLVCVTRTGGYWVSLLDSYGASFTYLVYAILECVGIAWMYGSHRFTNDIRSMIGDRAVDSYTFYWWPLNWCVFTPGLMTFVLMFNFLDWSDPEYNGPYPGWANAIGYFMFILALIWIPVNIIYQFVKAEGGLANRWHTITNPLPEWGPALHKHRLEAYKIHLTNGTTMGGRIDMDGSGRPVPIPPEYLAELSAVDNTAFEANARV